MSRKTKISFAKVKDLLCPVCSDIFEEPVRLLCKHVYCRRCAMSLREHSLSEAEEARLGGKALQCIKCRLCGVISATVQVAPEHAVEERIREVSEFVNRGSLRVDNVQFSGLRLNSKVEGRTKTLKLLGEIERREENWKAGDFEMEEERVVEELKREMDEMHEMLFRKEEDMCEEIEEVLDASLLMRRCVNRFELVREAVRVADEGGDVDEEAWTELGVMCDEAELAYNLEPVSELLDLGLDLQLKLEEKDGFGYEMLVKTVVESDLLVADCEKLMTFADILMDAELFQDSLTLFRRVYTVDPRAEALVGVQKCLFALKAKSGNAEYEEKLGNLMLKGDTFKKDVEKGMEWLRRAASHGKTSAMVALGRYHLARHEMRPAHAYLAEAARRRDRHAHSLIQTKFAGYMGNLY